MNSKRAGKYATETSSNSSDLLSFKSSVDSQCNYEVAAASATGAAICAAAVAAVTAPTGLVHL
ncbi:geobacillin-26 family protein [Desulforamulus profundi]|uniref:geobacillin-26 family protein n=1 Tax=Desulforamulus profundi TaxID=1383067 RepID=UPI003B75CEB9